MSESNKSNKNSTETDGEMYPGRAVLVGYLAKSSSEDWSYINFLKLNSEFLVDLPPFLDFWNVLDGTWTGRFLREVKEMNPALYNDVKRKVNSEHDDVTVCRFWEEVISKRNRLKLRNILDTESIKLLKSSSKFQSQKAQEDYEDLMKSSRDKRSLGSTANNEVTVKKIKTTQGSSKRKSPSKMSTSANDVENWKPSGYINNYDLSGEIDDFFNSLAEKKLPNLFSNKLQELDDETDDEEGETKSENQRLNDGDLNEEFPPSENNNSSLCQDSSSISIDANDNHEQNQHQAGYCQSSSDLFEDDYEVEHDSYNKDNVKSKKKYQSLFLLTKEHREIIKKAYKEMKRERMWKLTTGRFVEEELFNLGNGLKSEHAVHSFILDIDDEVIRQHFSEVELKEIDSVSGPQVLGLSSDVTGCLSKFIDKTSLKEIRETIKDLMLGNEYDHEKHHDVDYIIFAIYALVREIQSESLKNVNLEAWFNCHIWNAILDQAFGDLKIISVVRGESTSLASASRKNAKRKFAEERRKMGRRGDWILRSITNGDKQEFGAGEAGKSWVDENGTKFLKEAGLKLPKTLKDMLVRLLKKADWDEGICAKIQTVGIIHAGLMLMPIYLDNPKGYVCRIRRGELMEVPDNAENFCSILTILASVLNIKAVVQETIKAVRSNKKIDAESFKGAGFRKRPLDENKRQISPCLSTPKKVKVCAETYTEKPYPTSPCPGSPQSELLP